MDPVERALVTGVCFPEKPTLQSVLPLLAVKDLLGSNKADVAYIALPVFAYAGAGLSRRDQYFDILGLMKKLYGNDLGERVFIVPDSRDEIMSMKYKICNLSSRFVSDNPAKEKYRFNNLFGYFETASYGADVVIGALAEGGKATVICDFRQFESIHAGNKMGKSMGSGVGALLYTLLSPTYMDGELREVSQDDGSIKSESNKKLPETSNLFYQAAVLFKEDQVVEIYDEYRKSGSVNNLEEQINKEKNRLFTFSPLSTRYIQDLEDKSIERINPVNDLLSEEIQKRTRIPDRHARRGVVYEQL